MDLIAMAAQESATTTVRIAAAGDAEAVAGIYNHYVARTVVTFEEEPVAACEISRRIAEVQAVSLPWLVAERAGAAVGFAYAAPWRARRAYRFSAEVTVYVAPERGGRGIGSALYAHLLAGLRDRNIHSVMGGIALPNEASVALHEKFGFKKVAHFEQAGFKLDRWVDVGYWQRIL
jgi:L-amino acid N-acyltransferase YncA